MVLTMIVNVVRSTYITPSLPGHWYPSVPQSLFLFYLTQPFISNAEVMGYLVLDHPGDFGNYLFLATAPLLDRLLEYCYFIRQYHSIVPAPPRLGYTFIEAKERFTTLQPGPACLGKGWTRLYHNVYVLQLAEKLIW